MTTRDEELAQQIVTGLKQQNLLIDQISPEFIRVGGPIDVLRLATALLEDVTREATKLPFPGSVRDVACPRCNAFAGEPCSVGGSVRTFRRTFHQERSAEFTRRTMAEDTQPPINWPVIKYAELVRPIGTTDQGQTYETGPQDSARHAVRGTITLTNGQTRRAVRYRSGMVDFFDKSGRRVWADSRQAKTFIPDFPSFIPFEAMTIEEQREHLRRFHNTDNTYANADRRVAQFTHKRGHTFHPDKLEPHNHNKLVKAPQ